MTMTPTSIHRVHPVRRRGGAMAATLAIHALALLLLLRAGPPVPGPTPPTTALSVFDVPPPPVIESPSPPPRPSPPRVAPREGGSPGRARTAPRRAPVRTPMPRRRAELLAETAPPTPSARAASPDLMALPDLVAATGGGVERGGDGGRGTGGGNGDGRGDGSTPLASALWLQMPSRKQFESYWPAQARRRNLGGRVTLVCIVPRPGPPRRCRVVDEYPTGVGFGTAALRMSPLFRIKPVTRGASVHSQQVVVPVRFDVPLEIKLPRLPTPG